MIVRRVFAAWDKRARYVRRGGHRVAAGSNPSDKRSIFGAYAPSGANAYPRSAAGTALSAADHSSIRSRAYGSPRRVLDRHDSRQGADDTEQHCLACYELFVPKPASDLTAHQALFGTAEHSAFIVSAFLDARANLADVFLLPNPSPRIGFAVECIHDARLAAILGGVDIAG